MRDGAAWLAMVAWTLTDASGALAQTVHEKIRPALVYLHASGIAKSGPNASNEVETFATGFLVSSDGLILTVHHLVGELGDVVPSSVRIEAHIAEKVAPGRPAAVVDANINTDLMLLKLQPAAGGPYQIMSASTRTYTSNDTIYTSGFPASDDLPEYLQLSSNIQAESGPGGYLWGTGLQFNSGQSGSPVYDGDGRVLGVVKGNVNAVGYIIPIRYADSLLAEIRFREIRSAMQDFEPLRRRIEWTGELNKTTEVFTLTCEKAVGGEPYVKSIDVAMVPRGEKSGAVADIIPPIKRYGITPANGVNGNVFELPRDLFDTFERYHVEFGYTSVVELRIEVNATMTDGSKLQSKRISVEY